MVPAASTLMPKASQTHVKALQRSSKAASTTRDGDYSIKISLKAQSGVFGTALRLVKPTGLLLFPGPEARFVGQDLEKAPVTLIDPQGQDSRCYELCSVSIMCNNALPCILSQLSMLTQVQLAQLFMFQRQLSKILSAQVLIEPACNGQLHLALHHLQ